MARNDPQVNLRYPAELKAKLDAAAAASRRSLTAEMVSRLEDSFAIDEYDDFPGFAPGESVSIMLADLKACKKLNDDLFDVTKSQSKTISAQADAIETQSATIKAQASLINRITAEQFYDYALEQMGDVPEEDLANQRSILNTAMEKAAKMFDFEWTPPERRREE